MDIVHFVRQTTVGISVTLLLLYLLTQNELLRAHGGRRAMRAAYATTLVSMPVLGVFVVVIAVRFLFLLRVL